MVKVSLLDAVFKVCQRLHVQCTCLPADDIAFCVDLQIFYYSLADCQFRKGHWLL
jgi:hypothetical protein